LVVAEDLLVHHPVQLRHLRQGEGLGCRVWGVGCRVSGVGRGRTSLRMPEAFASTAARSWCSACLFGGWGSQFKNNYFTEMCSGSEEGSYVRLIDLCTTQL